MSNNWYAVEAKGPKRATIAIDGFIGAFGVTGEDFRRDVTALGDIENLKIKMNSGGGNVVEGLGIAEIIANHPAKTHVSIEGMAGSIASVIAAAADRVTMTKNSLYFIHNAAATVRGTPKILRKAADDLETMQQSAFGFYHDRPSLNLSDEELAEALDKETYYNAESALDAGFIDAIQSKTSDLSAVAAQLDDNLSASLPQEFLMQVEMSLATVNPGSSAATTTEGKHMSDEKTYTEAELQAKIAEAVDAAKKDDPGAEAAAALASMLADENATIERVQFVAGLGLDAEKASAVMAQLAKEASAKAESPAAKPADAPVTPASLMQQVVAMANRDLDKVNMNASTDDDQPKKKAETPEEILARLNGPSLEVV